MCVCQLIGAFMFCFHILLTTYQVIFFILQSVNGVKKCKDYGEVGEGKQDNFFMRKDHEKVVSFDHFVQQNALLLLQVSLNRSGKTGGWKNWEGDMFHLMPPLAPPMVIIVHTYLIGHLMVLVHTPLYLPELMETWIFLRFQLLVG